MKVLQHLCFRATCVFLVLCSPLATGQGFPHFGDISTVFQHVSVPPIMQSILRPILGDKSPVSLLVPPSTSARLFLLTPDQPDVKQTLESPRSTSTQARVTISDPSGTAAQSTWTDRISKATGFFKGSGNRQARDDDKGITGKRVIKIIVHGWGESASRQWYADMTQAYLEAENKTGDVNSVVQVDWSVEAASEYSVAAFSTRRVGYLIAQFVSDIYSDLEFPMENVHIIGHSLGGHVAGFAGKEIQRLTGEKVGRITALDPAGPLFEGNLVTKANRLSDTDAKFVDIVHTDGGFYGYAEPLGIVDFFPNGGVRNQPGCTAISQDAFSLDKFMEFTFCSHTRSYYLFIESIRSDSDILARNCDSWSSFDNGLCANETLLVFGDRLPVVTAAPGNYYFNTNAETPYGIPIVAEK